MLKQLTLAVLTAALLPACVIGTDDTTTSISSSSSSGGTTGLTSTSDPTSGTTDPTASEGSTINPTSEGSTTIETPTTGSTSVGTVSTTTIEGTSTDTSDGTTVENTTGQGGFGLCGWYAEMNFYACENDGAVASLEDPEGLAPIACPDGLVEGAECSEEMGPIKGVGCCTPAGTLWYCDSLESKLIFKEECGT